MMQLRRHPRPHRRAPQTPRPGEILRPRPREPINVPTHLVAIQPVVPTMHRARPQPVIPPIPAGRRNHRRRGMPARISHNRLPHAASAIVIVPIHVPLIIRRPGVLRRGLDVDRLGRLRAVEVPDVDFAVVGAGVDVAAVGAVAWGEVAADESLEDAMAAEGD